MNKFETEERINRNASEIFKIDYLRPYQLLITSALLEEDNRQNLLAVLPTGSGKSLCFMLPAVMLDGITVIVYPLLSLMSDQEKRFRKLSIPCTLLKGGQSQEERNEVFRKLYSRESKILITNIEMLNQHRIRNNLRRMKISLLVLDEAHTVIAWGNSFRPAYRSIKEVCDELRPGRIVAFTATSDRKCTEELKETVLGNDALVIFGGSNRSNIIYHRVKTIFPLLDIIHIISSPASRPALVFCQSRELTQQLASRLSPFFRTYHYHAGLDKDTRNEIENSFYSDREAVMVSTCAYGMGVDKPDIRTVIHYSLPQNAADYLQESGRAGRDGKTSHAYAFLCNSFHESQLEELFSKDECIRENLIKAMGQAVDEECTGCDVCNGTKCIPQGAVETYRQLWFPYLYKKDTLIRKLMHKEPFSILSEKEIAEGISRMLRYNMIISRFNRLRRGKPIAKDSGYVRMEKNIKQEKTNEGYQPSV